MAERVNAHVPKEAQVRVPPQQAPGVHTQRGPVPRGRAPPPPRKHPPSGPYVVFHGKCDIGERLPTPQPFEADEIHAEAELGRGSYFRSE